MKRKKLIPWFSASLIIMLFFSSVAVTVKTAQRVEANFPQIQIAEDTVDRLNQGAPLYQFVTTRVNVNRSLAPFIIIYDKAGTPIKGTGYLNGHLPTIPIGVLRAAIGKDYHAVTWQPQAGVRIAAVSASANNYYVLSGRSLKEVELNGSITYQLMAIGCFASLFVLATTFYIYRKP